MNLKSDPLPIPLPEEERPERAPREVPHRRVLKDRRLQRALEDWQARSRRRGPHGDGKPVLRLAPDPGAEPPRARGSISAPEPTGDASSEPATKTGAGEPQGVLQSLRLPDSLLSNVKRSGAARHAVQPREVFRSGSLRAIARLFLWSFLVIRLLAGNLWDIIRRRGTVERQAERLRLALQRGGPTFVKIGQQLSLRIDLLPYQYAAELEKMLDQVEPFSSDYAIQCVEEAIGGPLSKVFEAFDPTPIGSASISCVYFGILKNGDKVAVKVRRPGVGEDLAADMKALGWLMFLAEFFFLPPGFTDNLMDELRNMLLAELDFRLEARVQELFRRQTRKAGLRYVTAPKLYYDLCSHRVIVEEFVNGVWLGDVLAAVESGDEKALAVLRQYNIRPKRLARRLLEVTRWSGFEGLLFHADLHPANVMVRRNSKIVLIDFGSSGAFTNKERSYWRALMRAQLENDVGGMAQASLGLLEPLPPLDIEELTKRLEQIFREHLYAYKSKHSEWWERTSAQLWISFLNLSREMQIPLNLNTLKMIRASMLVDTLALRLDRNVDQYKEFRKYSQGAGRRALKRLMKQGRRFWEPATFVEIEGFVQTVRGLLGVLQRTASAAQATTTSLIGKASYAISSLIQMSMIAVASMTVGVTIVAVREYRQGIHATLWDLSLAVVRSTPFQMFMALVLVIYGRRVAFRLLDTDDD